MTALRTPDEKYASSEEGPHSHEAQSTQVEAHEGVQKIEAIHKVFGKYSKWALFISIALASYIYSLDGTTTWTYLAFATSSFGRHSLISTIQVAQAVIVACGKPVVAKIADVTSRSFAYCFALLFYTVGYIVIASANSAETIAGGIILYAVGYTGLQLLIQIIIADITTLKWRALVSSLTSTPFIINAFVSSNISANIMEQSGWRWGYGMFAILVPAALAPLIVTLLWAEHKSKKDGLYVPKPSDAPLSTQAFRMLQALDIPGLSLLGAAVALILLPITLSKTAKGGWDNPSMIAMIVIGCVLLPSFVLYDWKFAKFPVVPGRFVRNKSVVGASLIGFFDFVSFYITWTYLYSFVVVTKDWTPVHVNYFAQSQTVALTVFGIMAGFIIRFTRRYKWQLVVGLCIRLLGVGIMIHARHGDTPDAEIVMTQLIQGIGGGIAAVASQVGAQASVPHADVATATAVVLLITEIGGAVGGAIAGGIWSNLMPDRLAHHLPNATPEQLAELFGSITLAAANPRGDPVREGVILAYGDVMKILTIVATVIAIFPILFALLMPDWFMGDTQNAVEQVDLTGAPVVEAPSDTESQPGSKALARA